MHAFKESGISDTSKTRYPLLSRKNAVCFYACASFVNMIAKFGYVASVAVLSFRTSLLGRMLGITCTFLAIPKSDECLQ